VLRLITQAFVLALASVVIPLTADAVPVLVRDVRPGPPGGLAVRDRMAFGAVGDVAWFAADDGVTGYEPYRSDGTPAGTMRVADVAFGEEDSAPYGFTALGDVVFFGASGNDGGVELWRSDGTSPGTYVVLDIALSGMSSFPLELTPIGDRLYFTAGEIEGGRELWRTNGTRVGTERVIDLEPGPTGSDPSDLAVMDGILYFAATVDGERELWRTDGTEPGTFMVRDLNGSSSATPSALTVVGDTLFFRAAGDGGGFELWKTDGSEPGTVQVKDIWLGAVGSEPDQLTAVGETLYFVADDGVSGPELWKSDGSSEGTLTVRNIGASGGSYPSHLTAGFNRVFFVAFEGATGRELWTSNGTPSGTVRLTDTLPGTSNGLDEFAELVVVNQVLYFRAVDPTRGPSLWQSDGSLAGTLPVADLVPGADGSHGDDDGPSFLTDVAGTLFFRAQDATLGLEPWALTDCGDGVASTVEECDDGNSESGDCCSATCRYEPAGARCGDTGETCNNLVCDGEGACDEQPTPGPCDDGATCTAGDSCSEGVCRGTLAGFDGVNCLLFELAQGQLCGDPLPPKLRRVSRKRARKALRYLRKLEKKQDQPQAVARLLGRLDPTVGTIAVKAADAARAPKEKDRVTVACAERLIGAVTTVQQALAELPPPAGSL